MLEVFCDGGSRGNPGPSAFGFVIYKDAGVVKEGFGYLGIETNNFAEYTALIKALEWLSDNYPQKEVKVMMDSQLVVSQLSGTYKVKSAKIRNLVFKVRQLEPNFSRIDYVHIIREKNRHADSLVNRALDNRG